MFPAPSQEFKNFSKPIALGLLSMVSLKAPRPAHAQKLGLSSSFGDVTLQNVGLGIPYPLRQLEGHGYAITNLSEVAVDLVIEPAAPLKGSLRPYYEPLPDTAWVKISPAKVHLAPGATAQGEVTIEVPKDEGWKDRNFQCALYTHTLQGSFVNVGIYDKLFFSTGAGPQAAQKGGPHLAWLPGELRVQWKDDGSLAAASGPSRLELLNASPSSATVHLEVEAPAPGAEAPAGYRAAAPESLHFAADSVVIQAGQTVEAPFSLEPAPEAGSYAYRVKAVSQTPGLETSGWVLVRVGSAAGRRSKTQ